jgi:hypothetical protein
MIHGFLEVFGDPFLRYDEPRQPRPSEGRQSIPPSLCAPASSSAQRRSLLGRSRADVSVHDRPFERRPELGVALSGSKRQHLERLVQSVPQAGSLAEPGQLRAGGEQETGCRLRRRRSRPVSNPSTSRCRDRRRRRTIPARVVRNGRTPRSVRSIAIDLDFSRRLSNTVHTWRESWIGPVCTRLVSPSPITSIVHLGRASAPH